MPLFVLKRFPRIFKDSLIGVARNLIPTSISALKPPRRVELLCKDFKVDFLGDAKKLHLRTRRTIYIAIQGKRGPDRALAKDTKASRHGWEKHLRRRDRAGSAARSHRTKLARSPVFAPRYASPLVSSHPSQPVPERAQVVSRRHAQLRQAKMRARMQRRKEVYRNVRNVFAGREVAGPTKDTEPLPLEMPMEDVQPAPLVYASRPRSPTTPTMSWFCRNLSQARSAQPRLPVAPFPPLFPPVEPISPTVPMPPSRAGRPSPVYATS